MSSSSSSDYAALGLRPELQRAAADLGYTAPTPIQAAAIPVALQGRDLRGMAQTGSGKTAAFALPLLQRWHEGPRHRSRRALHSLVLVPTRELATQVAEHIAQLAVHLPERPKVVRAIGGVSINPQLMALRGGADIVVGTPGRVLDLADHNALRLQECALLVLDEADRLLDLGFADELDQILDALPAQRQNLLFSATFAPRTAQLADALLKDPVAVQGQAPTAELPLIRQRAIEVDEGRRTGLLRHLIAQEGWRQVLVFVATKHACETVADKLRKAGLAAEPLHGVLGQGKRTQVLADFKAGRLQVLVATDLAARGIDIAQLPVVVNHDLARSATDHVHRIGRTGRAGSAGVALSFVSAAAEGHFRLIEKRQGLRVPRERIAGFEPVQAAPADAPAPGGGIKGKRPSKKDKLRAAAAATAAAAAQPKGGKA
ncbi:DEAD/DEAH box helicase [Xenophilus arseniciresistens]|uniref:DEAD/DEAH box helicase n=1 Tax=Xenophilus arseniciresistens TaxID=1283306 RepID=A0AAE3T135_9BURK|nr:DEAD/DEAH box helicase [Xenophilus arseniciresistens]MDA7416947.1 DEAD/DEAH box helicase [Xenophilus arseniciresistens]